MDIASASILIPNQRNLEAIVSLDRVRKLRTSRRPNPPGSFIYNLVKVEFGYEEGDNKVKKTGTGLLLTREGFLITAFHLISDSYPILRRIDTTKPIEKVIDYFSMTDVYGRRFPLDVTYVSGDRKIDILLLKAISPEPLDFHECCLASSVSEDDTVGLINFEMINGLPSFNSRAGRVLSVSQDKNHFFVEGIGKLGESGSPYFNLDDEIVGVQSGTYDKTKSVAVHIDAIRELIDNAIRFFSKEYRPHLDLSSLEH